MHNENSNMKLITIEADQATLKKHLHKSDQDDVSPKDLTVSFMKISLETAMKILPKYPELFSVSIQAEINSNDFAGDIEGGHITIYNRAKTVYARFSNGYTGTEYELEITSAINIDSELITPSIKKYLRHILHGQIESEAFWREQVESWDTDCAGNTPEQQFELILEESSQFDYLMQQIEYGAHGTRVFCGKHGAGTIVQVHKECPASIVVDVEFDDGKTLGDISVAELSNWVFL